MLELLELFMPILVLCGVLVGMHAYLGLHVLSRGVIFIDLSLAQVAALGALLSQAVFHAEHAGVMYACSLLATLLAAALLTWLSRRRPSESLEAYIGVVFAGASALSVLVLDQLDVGHDHLRHSLFGNMLYVSWPEVLRTAAIYAGVGALCWKFHSKLLAQSQKRTERPWVDFLFYSLFSVVIVSSVALSGVLVVFAFLIGPALMVSQGRPINFGRQLIHGWGVGMALSCVGFGLSLGLDLPTGPVLVALFSVGAALWGLLGPRSGAA